ncbi:MAG: helix-turn-helix domain-containing protein [Oscillospiraceae bacterium]|nr:helix-turn-helix domain-containing protein [Oscillospiraceae bacterium]
MLHLRLAELRNKKGISQAELAADLRISRQAYSLYEINKRQMNYETLCLLADYHEVSTDYLLGRQDIMPSFLDEEERGIIKQYRALGEHARGTIKNCLSFEYERAAKTEGVKKSAG